MGLAWVDLILKIPVLLVVLAVWWAIRHTPQEPPSTSDDDGGIRRASDRPHPIPPFPRTPRRGPHGDLPPQAPSRVRTVKARARTLGH